MKQKESKEIRENPPSTKAPSLRDHNTLSQKGVLRKREIKGGTWKQQGGTSKKGKRKKSPKNETYLAARKDSTTNQKKRGR